MKTLDYLEHPSDPFEVAIARAGSGHALNIAGVYQDAVTRQWANESYLRATKIGGAESVQKKWYDLNALNDPEILIAAVDSTLLADVIMVSVYVAEELPLNLYVWITAWLPRRPARTGAMTAWVGAAESQDSQTRRSIKYLQAVARRAQLEFVPQPPPRASASSTISQPIQQADRQLYLSDRHWGLNE